MHEACEEAWAEKEREKVPNLKFNLLIASLHYKRFLNV